MINRVVLMGRLVFDVELKTTTTGISVMTNTLAVDRNYCKQGEERKTDFIPIVAWRQNAEFMCRQFEKGSLIAIDGELQSRNYDDKNGNKRTAIEVIVDNASFTGERRDVVASNSKPNLSVEYDEPTPTPVPQQQTQPKAQPVPDQPQLSGFTDDDDLPF